MGCYQTRFCPRPCSQRTFTMWSTGIERRPRGRVSSVNAHGFGRSDRPDRPCVVVDQHSGRALLGLGVEGVDQARLFAGCPAHRGAVPRADLWAVGAMASSFPSTIVTVSAPRSPAQCMHAQGAENLSIETRPARVARAAYPRPREPRGYQVSASTIAEASGRCFQAPSSSRAACTESITRWSGRSVDGRASKGRPRSVFRQQPVQREARLRIPEISASAARACAASSSARYTYS